MALSDEERVQALRNALLRIRMEKEREIEEIGKLKIRTEITFPLANVAEAHRDLEGRKTTGKVLLIP